MLYKLLGFVVWKGAKRYLRRRYGPAMLMAAVALIGVGAVVAAFRLRESADR